MAFCIPRLTHKVSNTFFRNRDWVRANKNNGNTLTVAYIYLVSVLGRQLAEKVHYRACFLACPPVCSVLSTTKMSKLQFRARALDASKPMPIYMAEELPDLTDYSAINRAVPQMPSGMEKEEECVSSTVICMSSYCIE